MSEAISGEMAGGDVGGGVDPGAGGDGVAPVAEVATAPEPSFTGIEYEGIETDTAPAATLETGSDNWWSGMSTDDQAFIQNKGWHNEDKGIAEMLRSYRMAESKIGGDPNTSIHVPNWDDPAQVQAYNAQLGVPSSAEEYPALEIQTARGQLEIGPIAEMSAAAGLLPHQHAIIAQMAGDLISETATQQEAQAQLTRTADAKRLIAEKGQDAKAFLNQVRIGRESVGVDDIQRDALCDALGVAKAMEILAMIGGATSEHKHPQDSNQPLMEGNISQDVAKERLKQRRADKGFFAKMEANDPEALKEWADLNAAAATRDI